jgi:hypothetical protein
MPVTFVTAFLDLKEDRSNDKSVEKCMKLFETLSQTDISIHLFLSKCYSKFVKHRHNIYIEYIDLEDLTTFKEVKNDKLPSHRTTVHDTKNFMILMNAKIEFVARAIHLNHFNNSHFSWIDFSIFHVLKNLQSSCNYLQLIHNSLLKDNCLIFPGCWPSGTLSDSLFEKINWRFCGGFFIGDEKSLLHMNDIYRTFFKEIVEHHGLSWEVNIWHYLELHHSLSIQWYQADHNDSIIRIPQTFFKCVASLTTIPSRIENECKLAIDSLLHQVDHIYLSVASNYRRFGKYDKIPSYFTEEPYKNNVTLVIGEDYGPASKYIGAVECIPKNIWVFCCDDDQEYKEDIIEKIKSSMHSMGIYQNHYRYIQHKTSGGLIHGYVGNLIHQSVLEKLKVFEMPEVARYVDDQWVSIFTVFHSIQIFPTPLEHYQDIFKVLSNGFEKNNAPDSLSALNNRNEKIKELEQFFNVQFTDKH